MSAADGNSNCTPRSAARVRYSRLLIVASVVSSARAIAGTLKPQITFRISVRLFSGEIVGWQHMKIMRS